MSLRPRETHTNAFARPGSLPFLSLSLHNDASTEMETGMKREREDEIDESDVEFVNDLPEINPQELDEREVGFVDSVPEINAIERAARAQVSEDAHNLTVTKTVAVATPMVFLLLGENHCAPKDVKAIREAIAITSRDLVPLYVEAMARQNTIDKMYGDSIASQDIHQESGYPFVWAHEEYEGAECDWSSVLDLSSIEGSVKFSSTPNEEEGKLRVDPSDLFYVIMSSAECNRFGGPDLTIALEKIEGLCTNIIGSTAHLVNERRREGRISRIAQVIAHRELQEMHATLLNEIAPLRPSYDEDDRALELEELSKMLDAAHACVYAGRCVTDAQLCTDYFELDKLNAARRGGARGIVIAAGRSHTKFIISFLNEHNRLIEMVRGLRTSDG
jgi:hypothetical protein